jgi:heme a synthase
VPISPTTTRRIFAAGVVAQMGIVVTGGLVRLTGSGLGCPSWPQCVSGSLTPVINQPQGFHKLIEFGNRTLFVIVALVGLACAVAAWQQVPRRRPVVLLASVALSGVFAQALLGGLTVLTGLNPFVVSSHFLLSMALIAAALAVYERSADAGDGPPRPLVRVELVWLARALVSVAAMVLVVGTLVTGSGPHSGDAEHPARNGFDPSQIAWLHADLVTLFFGLVIALLLAVRLAGAPAVVGRRVRMVLYVTLGQGALGYVQYFTGVPWVLVAFHVLGATLLWVSVLRVTYAMRSRRALSADAVQPSADTTAAANLSAAPPA